MAALVMILEELDSTPAHILPANHPSCSIIKRKAFYMSIAKFATRNINECPGERALDLSKECHKGINVYHSDEGSQGLALSSTEINTFQLATFSSSKIMLKSLSFGHPAIRDDLNG
jgi:hypothetical protein